MQYILTEEEYQDFLKDRDDLIRLEKEIVEVQSKLVHSNNELYKYRQGKTQTANELYKTRLKQQQLQSYTEETVETSNITQKMNDRCRKIGVSTNKPNQLVTKFKELLKENPKSNRMSLYGIIAKEFSMKTNDVSALIRMKEKLQGVRK
jgi:hypothetical protein